MLPSIFNVRVPLPEQGEVFLMNTFSDAQLLVSPDVTDLLDRIGEGQDSFDDDEPGVGRPFDWSLDDEF